MFQSLGAVMEKARSPYVEVANLAPTDCATENISAKQSYRGVLDYLPLCAFARLN